MECLTCDLEIIAAQLWLLHS